MNKVSDKEILEDMTAMLKHTVDFERTLEMVKLNDDELLIFKRAWKKLNPIWPYYEKPTIFLLSKATPTQPTMPIMTLRLLLVRGKREKVFLPL